MSITLQLHLDADHPLSLADIKAISAVVEAYGEPKEAVRRPISTFPAAPIEPVAKAANPEPGVKKRGRRSNAEIAAAKAAEASTTTEVQATVAEVTQKAETESAELGSTLTLDALREALKVYGEKNGMEAVLALLTKHGCQRVSEMADKPLDEQKAFLAVAGK